MVDLPVFYRGDAVKFPEGLSKIGLRGKTCGTDNIGDGKVRIPEKLTGSLQPALIQILDR